MTFVPAYGLFPMIHYTDNWTAISILAVSNMEHDIPLTHMVASKAIPLAERDTAMVLR